MARHTTRRRLSTAILGTIMAYSLFIMVFFGGVFSFVFYFSSEHRAEDHLQMIAENAAQALNDAGTRTDISAADMAAAVSSSTATTTDPNILATISPEADDLAPIDPDTDALAILHYQFNEGIRYTLIDADGTVLFDSQGDLSEDHSDRPEVIEAIKTGKSAVVRHSDTLGQDLLYAAIELDSGSILRLSEQRESVFSFAESLAFPLFVALLISAALSSVVSRLITRRLVAPLEDIDVSAPLETDTYEEMRPFLTRIDTQRSQLKAQNQELARAENLRREFSANVSHELKTPLQVISGYAELLASPNIPPQDAQRFALVIGEEATHMRELIDDVLTLSRLDDPVLENAGKEPIELFALTKTAAEALLPLAEKNEVIVRVLGNKTEIVGNPTLLTQIIRNVIGNAIAYSNRGGEVTVMVDKTLVAEGLNEDLPQSEAYIRVKDTGIGISPEDQEKIFERFYRVDKSRSKERGGTGLGLAIAKHAAAFHGGTITVESQRGKGATFTVHLPLN